MVYILAFKGTMVKDLIVLTKENGISLTQAFLEELVDKVQHITIPHSDIGDTLDRDPSSGVTIKIPDLCRAFVSKPQPI